MTETLYPHDDDLGSAVTADLRRTPTVNSTTVGVSAHDGAVTLSGEVESYPELLATKAAQRVRGVTAAAQISVHTPCSTVNDSDISREGP